LGVFYHLFYNITGHPIKFTSLTAKQKGETYKKQNYEVINT
jgi:hypothetical protein